MAYLGRPSGGDSPFAIGDRAMRDTSSPQPPTQRNPIPRSNYMATPSPYGSVSEEARRRYEERYARKRAEEEAKRREEAIAQQQAQQPQQPPLQANQLPPRQQQYSARPPPQQMYQQGQPPQYAGGHPQQRPPPQRQYSGHGPPPRQQEMYQQQPPQQQQQQQQYHPQQSPTQQYHQQGRQPSYQGQGGYQSPPPGQPSAAQQLQQQYQQHQQSPHSNHRTSQQSIPPQQQQQQQAPPPRQQQQQPQFTNEEAELRALFTQFDSSRTGQSSSYDSQRLSEKDATMEAREDCVKMLMSIFDTDRSGSINFMEFEGSYRYIQDWHGIFGRFDQDQSGSIDRRESHDALEGFGFSSPSDMVRKSEKRFAPPPKAGGNQNTGISFDRFLMACVTVKHYTEAFRNFDPNGTGRATMDYNSYMDIMSDAPS